MGEVDKYCVRCRLVSPINCFKLNRKNAYNKCCDNCLIKMRVYQHENKEAISMLTKIIIKILKKLFAFIQNSGEWIILKSVLFYTGHIIWKI